MQDSLHELLEENLRLTRENNKMLKSMRRAALIGRVMRVVFVISILAGLYYVYVNYLEPYYEDIQTTMASIKGEAERFKELEERLPESVQRLFGGGEESLNETQ